MLIKPICLSNREYDNEQSVIEFGWVLNFGAMASGEQTSQVQNNTSIPTSFGAS